MSSLRALLLILLAAAAPAAAVDVVVLPVAGLHPQALRASVTAAVRAEASALGIDVLAAPATDRVIADAAAFGNTCAVTVSTCAIQMGSLAGARRVVVGAIDGGLLILRAYDVATVQEIGRVSVAFDPSSPAAAARLATIRLLRPEEELGTLALTTDVFGAVVEVDGRQVGATPLAPLGLTPGPHTVVVRPLEFELASQSATVDIALGAVTGLELTFRPDTPRPRRDGPAASTPVAVYVLDVEAPSELALPAALLTAGLVDEIRNRLGDDAQVGTPQDFARLVPGGLDLIADCAADAGCIRGRLRGRGAVELIATSLVPVEDHLMVNSARFRLDTDQTLTSAEAHAPGGGGGVALARQIGTMVSALFPDKVGGLVVGVDKLEARFNPPPVPLWAWAGSLAGLGVGGAIGGGALVAYAGAPPDDPARQVWGAVVVVGAVVAAAGLAATIVEIPFVDWHGLQGENAALLEERAARGYSSR